MTHGWMLGLECGLASGIGIGVAGAVTVSQAVALVLLGAGLRFSGVAHFSLMGFLADAKNRQVLRQVGTLYQFRHGELQDYLAGVGARYGDSSGVGPMQSVRPTA